jgi:hypothetical protein
MPAIGMVRKCTFAWVMISTMRTMNNVSLMEYDLHIALYSGQDRKSGLRDERDERFQTVGASRAE